MADFHPLRGSCSCGRYRYVVAIPEDSAARQQAQVHFGTSSGDRHLHSSLLSAFLKVPLSWYQSSTVSFYPDERHDLISRTFTPIDQPGCQRKFCGYCGTHLSYWTEQPIEEQDYLNITLGSLRSRDLHALDDLDLLLNTEQDAPSEVVQLPATGQDVDSSSTTGDQDVVRSSARGNTDGISWFEDIIDGSRLGVHSKIRRGKGQSEDGSTTVQWEISEYYGEDAADVVGAGRVKRKAVEITSDDVQMKG